MKDYKHNFRTNKELFADFQKVCNENGVRSSFLFEALMSLVVDDKANMDEIIEKVKLLRQRQKKNERN